MRLAPRSSAAASCSSNSTSIARVQRGDGDAGAHGAGADDGDAPDRRAASRRPMTDAWRCRARRRTGGAARRLRATRAGAGRRRVRRPGRRRCRRVAVATMASMAACTCGPALAGLSAAAAASAMAPASAAGTARSRRRCLRPASWRAWATAAARRSPSASASIRPCGQRRSAADTLAAADHGDGARNAHDARQSLRAARAGDDAQRHFRQAHHRARRRDACVAAQGQLEAAAQRRAVQRRHHGLAAVFDGLDHGGQLGLGQGLAEFAQIGARDEGAAGTDEHGAVQAVIGL